MVANRGLAVIKELRGDSRQTLTDIGRTVSVPLGSLFSLVRRLERGGVIRRYVSLVDFGRLG
ncbi:MAG: winged helix-turn-helix transcriptional regulator, partial [Nanoarchaeota archaeon]|nr:winged helix-turn-helix transcriptional regulator [Nanoarchaeota archaeon]